MARQGRPHHGLSRQSFSEDQAAASGWRGWLEERRYTLQEFRRFSYHFRRNTLSIAGIALILLLVLLAVAGGSLAPYPGDATGDTHLKDRLLPPSVEHPFGTDELGRDVFSRVILGVRLALQTGLLVLVVGISVGVLVGAASGFIGGFLDDIVMRITDVFLTLPYLILAIVVAVALGPGLKNAILALSVVWWSSYSRLMRGEVLRTREELYVLSSESMGASRPWIILRHVMPNSLSPIIVRASMDMGTVILAAASLGFIGLGAQPPQPDWGHMISEGRRIFPTFWWVATFPGLAIFVSVLAFNLFGDGLRDVLEPSSRR